MQLLPHRIEPGQVAEGDILFQNVGNPEVIKRGGDDPNADWYLFFGNWMRGQAWSRINLGTLPDLYDQLAEMMHDDPPMPWISIRPGSAGGPPPGTRGVPSWARPDPPVPTPIPGGA
ncbi:hypothetical protein JCM13210_16330 [Thermaerobacter litoralis]